MNRAMSVLGRMAVVGAAAVCLAGTALAQQPATDAPHVRDVPEPRFCAITVEFSGGTVLQYVQALKEACKPHPVNVVLSESAATDRLAPISLRAVSLAAAMQAIPAASSSGVNSWQIVRLMDALPGETAVQDNALAAPVYQVYRAPARKDSGQQRVIMEVFSVQRIVGRESDAAAAEKRVAAVLTAAETALRMDDHHATAPEMKFHKESGLLIVRGEQEDVMAVKDVIERMSDDSGKAAEEAARRESVARQIEIGIRKAELNVKNAQSQLDLSKAKLGQVEQLAAKGAVSSTEALEMKAEVDRRAAAHELAVLEFEAAKTAIDGGDFGVMRVASRSSGRLGGVLGADEENDLRRMVQQLRDENAELRMRLEETVKKMHDMMGAMEAGKANNPPGKK